jgi:hypothetical protein
MAAECGCLVDDLSFSGMASIPIGYGFFLENILLWSKEKGANI